MKIGRKNMLIWKTVIPILLKTYLFAFISDEHQADVCGLADVRIVNIEVAAVVEVGKTTRSPLLAVATRTSCLKRGEIQG